MAEQWTCRCCGFPQAIGAGALCEKCKPQPNPTPELTAEEMAHAVCENQWGQEGVVKSERDAASRVLLPLVTRRDAQTRRKAFEEAGEIQPARIAHTVWGGEYQLGWEQAVKAYTMAIHRLAEKKPGPTASDHLFVEKEKTLESPK